ncbi:MAG TPA: hypothetical protein VHT91_43750 [Kofleriaceae bacterium]|nr:hypothetical protein [Kofleriaceae bacterium]
MNRQPRDHDADDHGAPAGADASLHPRFRPVLRGHVARRHLRPAADLPPHAPG